MVPHICIVDDDLDILRLVAAGLDAAGLRVTALNDPLTAPVEVARLEPDLVILDVEMPGKSGLELCADLRMRPALRDMPIIFLTSRSESQIRIQGMQGGAIDYITKPFQIPDLLGSIRAILAVCGDWKRQRETLPGPDPSDGAR